MEELRKLYEQRSALMEKNETVTKELQDKIAKAEDKVLRDRLSSFYSAAEALFDGIQTTFKVEVINEKEVGIRADLFRKDPETYKYILY